MKLPELTRNLRLDLSDTDPTAEEWSNDELTRALEHCIGDIDRVLPHEKAYEVTIIYTVTDEAFTSDHDAWVSLANSPIKPEGEVVRSASGGGGTLYVRDTDYTMDYINGKIMCLSTGSIVDSTTTYISYTKSRLAVNISSLTDLIRVKQVEYPIDEVPQSFVGYRVWGDWLYVVTKPGSKGDATPARRGQAEMSSGEHLVVYYQAQNTPPTDAADGSYPTFLDFVVLKGAAAYAHFMRGLSNHLQAETDLTSARTELSGIAAIITAVETALGNVAAHVTEAGTALAKVATHGAEAKAALDKVDTIIVQVGTVLAGMGSIIVSIGTQLTNAEETWTTPGEVDYEGGALIHLTQGTGLINTVTVGRDAANLRRLYAETSVAIGRLFEHRRDSFLIAASRYVDILSAYINEAAQHTARANAYTGESSQRNAIASNYIAEATQRLNMAQTYIAEASGRLNEAQWKLASASQYGELAVRDMELAVRFREEGAVRHAEYWAILRDRAQWRGETVSVSGRQPKG